MAIVIGAPRLIPKATTKPDIWRDSARCDVVTFSMLTSFPISSLSFFHKKKVIMRTSHGNHMGLVKFVFFFI